MDNEATRVMSEAEMDATERRTEARLADARSLRPESDVEARVREYLQRPYHMEIRGDPEEGYLATVRELPGCVTAGETPEDALRMLRDAMATWLEAALVAGDQIPEPGEDRYSGRILLRMPKSLHAQLAEQAARDSVSINQLAVTLVAQGLERQRANILVDAERALDTTGLSPGPDLELRRVLGAMIRMVASQQVWDPSSDMPGAIGTEFANAYLRFMGSLPPEVLEEIKRRIALLQPRHDPADRPASNTGGSSESHLRRGH